LCATWLHEVRSAWLHNANGLTASPHHQIAVQKTKSDFIQTALRADAIASAQPIKNIYVYPIERM
jgi:hypothetical protein